MKKIIYSLAILGMSVLLSCDKLISPEVGQSGVLTANDVMHDYGNMQSALNGIYPYLPDGFFYIAGANGGAAAMLACASDEAEFTDESNAVQKFNTGAWNDTDNPDPAWQNNYAGIYAANLFLQSCDSINLDYLLLDPSKASQYDVALANIARWKYEARFLRAFFYFELVKRYGGVPLVTAPMGLDSDYKNVARNTLAECIQFISDECDSTAANLPIDYTQIDDNASLGRATKGAALALKSRVLLYAASDLFNSPDSWAPGYDHPELISMTDNKTRQERWIEAAQAAYAVIQMGVYSLNPSTASDAFGGLFRTFNSPEIIFARRYGSDNTYESTNYPLGFYGKSGATPLGNLVDDFDVRQSTSVEVPFDWTNPAHAANPYATTRDKRMNATILKNGDALNIQSVRENNPVLQIYTGGLDGRSVPGSTKTGYYINKYLDPTLDLSQGQSSTHTWILLRYAEIELNYAEAVNEAYGPTQSYPGATNTPTTAINDLRRRAGMPQLAGASLVTDQAKMRDLIRHERRVEMAMEDQRIWDVRRWMIAPQTLGAPARGVDAVLNADSTFTYTPFILENRVWEDKMYLYPIPLKELKITQGWEQNPLW